MKTRPEMIIDPPVGPFSSVSDIEAWLAELATSEPHYQVDAAIAEVKEWLEVAKETERLKKNA